MAAPKINFKLHSSDGFRTVGGSAFQDALSKALSGGAATQNYVNELSALAQFLKVLHDKRYAFVCDTKDHDGDPIKRATYEFTTSGVGVTLVASVKFIDGPGYAFDPRTGLKYVAVGTVTLATTTGQQSTSLMLIDADSGERNREVLQVLLRSLWNGFQAFVDKMMSANATSLAEAEALLSDASDAAIEAGAIEGEEIADGALAVSVEWMVTAAGLVAIAALIAIPIILAFIEKRMTHKLIVYNATDVPLQWRLSYVDEGASSLRPKSNLIPAMERGQTIVVSGGNNTAEALLLGSAEFHFVNTNGLKGIGYLLQFDPNEAMPHGATVMIDIPFWGDNSMYVSFAPQAESGEALYESLEGAHKVTSMRDTLDRYSATLTYNALSGECDDPTEGGSGYYYSSILVFQGQADVPYASLPPTVSGWSQAFSQHQRDGYLKQCPNWTRDNDRYRVRYRYSFVTASGQESARSPWSVLGAGIAGTTDAAGYINGGDFFMAQLELPVDSLGRAKSYNVYRQFEGAEETLLRWPEFHAQIGATLCLDNDG